MTAPETLLCFSRRKKRKKNPTGASKESSRKMRKKNQTRKWKKTHSSYSSDSSIPPSSSSGYSPDLGNARARIRAKENDNYKKKIKRPRRSHSPRRDRTKSKRRKLEGSVRKGSKSKLREKQKRKKNEKLKHRGRDTSVSSDFTPRSQSCSTCRSSSSGDICKGRSSKARGLSRSKKNKKYNDRGGSRSPIYSSSDDSISSHCLERIGEKSSLRMSKEAERGYNFDTEVGSMEVNTKDHGNSLSSKRNGSFDGLNGRESVDALERYAGTDYCVEGEEKEVSFVGYVGNEERSRPSMRIKSIVVIPAANDIEEEDLESLLRQKALENLKKFRGKSCSLSAQSSIHRNVDDLKSQLPSISDGRICIEKEFGEKGCPDSVNVAFKENVCLPVGDKADVKDESHQLGLSVDTAAKPLRQTVSLMRTMEKSNGTEVANPPNSSSSQVVSSRLSSSHTSNRKKHLNSLNQVKSGQDNQNENMLNQSSVECGISEMEGAVQSDKIRQGSNSKTSSTIDVNSRPETANGPKTDARNDSGLEEKTMTVMRGGERVQVSYKVYIPKKTPAMVRRHLKR